MQFLDWTAPLRMFAKGEKYFDEDEFYENQFDMYQALLRGKALICLNEFDKSVDVLMTMFKFQINRNFNVIVYLLSCLYIYIPNLK